MKVTLRSSPHHLLSAAGRRLEEDLVEAHGSVRRVPGHGQGGHGGVRHPQVLHPPQGPWAGGGVGLVVGLNSLNRSVLQFQSKGNRALIIIIIFIFIIKDILFGFTQF